MEPVSVFLQKSLINNLYTEVKRISELTFGDFILTWLKTSGLFGLLSFVGVTVWLINKEVFTQKGLGTTEG